jgi:DNA-binding MarR family transcriptional regulator
MVHTLHATHGLAASSSRPRGSAPVVRPERHRLLLAELTREEGAIVAFAGLRRRLGWHPQILSRALRDLEDQGDIAGGREGYQATEQGRLEAEPAAEEMEILRLVLTASLEARLGSLAGRWLEDLRWFGRSEGPGETTYLWTDGEGRMVRLRLRGGVLSVAGPSSALEAVLRLLAAL